MNADYAVVHLAILKAGDLVVFGVMFGIAA